VSNGSSAPLNGTSLINLSPIVKLISGLGFTGVAVYLLLYVTYKQDTRIETIDLAVRSHAEATVQLQRTLDHLAAGQAMVVHIQRQICVNAADSAVKRDRCLSYPQQ
jgi:hypothetical protein